MNGLVNEWVNGEYGSERMCFEWPIKQMVGWWLRLDEWLNKLMRIIISKW